jgi:hypothetical protein
MSNRQGDHKLQDIGQVGVFLGKSKNTTKYMNIYSLELDYTGHSSRIIINETQNKGDLDLRLRNYIAGSQEE